MAEEIERARRDPQRRLAGCLLLEPLQETKGTVLYRAWDEETRRLAAVRVFPAAQELAPKQLKTLKALRKLRAPGLATPRRYGVDRRRGAYVISSLPEGRLLASFRFKPKHVVLGLRDAARIVHALNRRGFLHEAIQPAGIFLTEEGRGAVIDFGLGELLAPYVSSRFRAPEVLRGTADPRSEVYALGASFYFGLTRQPPGTGQVVPPRQLRGGIPRRIQEICLRCLATEPGERYPTPGHLASDLSEFLTTGERKRG
ncbi:MAG: hypothetical protein D6731_22930 [Planctomycetota bacterium]|nr:MAG: hypothetical protein D6731_22930 [Planctomycetota bacterium]